ncbi:MAG: hypothetical protein ABEI57_04120, partial [Halapricum sp.]
MVLAVSGETSTFGRDSRAVELERSIVERLCRYVEMLCGGRVVPTRSIERGTFQRRPRGRTRLPDR